MSDVCAVGPCQEFRISGTSYCAKHGPITPWRSKATKPAGEPLNPRMVCPHCQVRGQIQTKQVTVKHGISGGKATAALLTGGFSLFATGLSRKGTATQATCNNCRVTWMI